MIYGADTRRGRSAKERRRLQAHGAGPAGSPRWCHLGVPAPLQRPPVLRGTPSTASPPAPGARGGSFPSLCGVILSLLGIAHGLEMPNRGPGGSLCAPQIPHFCGVAPPPRCSSRVWGAHPELGEPPGLCFALQILPEPGTLPMSPLCRGAQSFALGAALA